MCRESTGRLTEVFSEKLGKSCDHEKSPACRAFLCITPESVSADVAGD
jgi:hypothetical protein